MNWATREMLARAERHGHRVPPKGGNPVTDSLSRILFVAIGSALAVAAGAIAFFILVALATNGG